MRMRIWQCSIVCALALVAVVSTTRPAAASRATCDELLAVLDTGQPVETVAQVHNTTRARVEVCIRLAQQRERYSEKRADFALRRADRGLSH